MKMIMKMKLEEVWKTPSRFFELLGEGKSVAVYLEKGAVVINGQKMEYSVVTQYYIMIGLDTGTEITLTRSDYTIKKP